MPGPPVDRTIHVNPSALFAALATFHVKSSILPRPAALGVSAVAGEYRIQVATIAAGFVGPALMPPVSAAVRTDGPDESALLPFSWVASIRLEFEVCESVEGQRADQPGTPA